MTSDRKIKANRANARLSTGPSTFNGRARSARNAFRHGLSLPVQSDQALGEEVQALASQIAGPNASAEVEILAYRVAEAEVDLRRVRLARHQLLTEALSEMPMAAREDLVSSTPQGAKKNATILSREVKALERYERRARSRRKFAIRAFDAASAASKLISTPTVYRPAKILQRNYRWPHRHTE